MVLIMLLQTLNHWAVCMTALRAVVIGGIGLTDNCVALESLVRNIKTSLYQPVFKQPVSIWNFF